jgi:hypothetical protein
VAHLQRANVRVQPFLSKHPALAYTTPCLTAIASLIYQPQDGRLGDDGVTDDLIGRLQRWRVDPAVIAYARDAIASGQTTETTVRRLRALDLCPQGFL